MHISTAVSILLWLQNLPTTSAAPASANAAIELVTLEVHKHSHLPSDLQSDAAEIIDYRVPGTT